MRRPVYGMLAVVLLVSLGVALPVSATPIDNDAFYRTWARTDRPVADVSVSRTWVWGPEAITPRMLEDYAGAPDGQRSVQYFDKARMEIPCVAFDCPGQDPDSLWSVTNGLLVVELVTGRMQVGDDDFIDRAPAEIPLAGDGDDSAGPTYATIGLLGNELPTAEGEAITRRLDRDGAVSDNPSLARYGVTGAQLVEVPGLTHQIAAPFWQFMITTDVINEYGSETTGPLFENPYYGTGYPISEAYWATVKVNDRDQDVLIQCFERRCLTYTPGNPEGWQVEAGNVGQHYYLWRYGAPPPSHFEPPPPGPEGQLLFVSRRDGNEELYLIAGDGTNLQRLTNFPGADIYPAWSPDGQQIAFIRYDQPLTFAALAEEPQPSAPAFGLYVMDADGGNVRLLTAALNNPGVPVWSPDGSTIAVTALPDGMSVDIYLINVDGSNLRNVTNSPESEGQPAWSPDGQKLLYDREHPEFIPQGANISLYILNLADGIAQRLPTVDSVSSPRWSPDGTQIVYLLWTNSSLYQEVYVMDADGGNPRDLSNRIGVETIGGWTPDGTKILYLSEGGGEGYTGDLYVIDPDGQNPVTLHQHEGVVMSGRWSPNGQRIVFIASHENPSSEPDPFFNSIYHLHVIGADGTGLRLLVQDEWWIMGAVWRPRN